METITKSELLKNFENQEFVQITFPKVPTPFAKDWSGNLKMVEISDDTVLHMRSPVQNIDHFNMVYKDGDKYYLEEDVSALQRVCRRAMGDDGDHYDWEDAEYCLYCAGYDLRKAVKIFKERY